MVPVQLRDARPQDQPTIRRMVRDAHLDPTGLHWSHFIVAATSNGNVVGVGQIRPYRWCHELGSLVIDEAWRGRGIGSMIVRALLEDEPGPVYLECGASLTGYYARFGFEEIPWWRAPVPLSLKAGAANLVARVFGKRIAVMRRG